MAPVTLQSIADALGVSRTTVSNAYNRPDQLTDELRRRILAAAREVGYAGPDPAARMLRTGHRNAIGLLFTQDLRFVFADPDTSAFLRGVTETAALAGTGLMLLPVPDGVDPEGSAVPTAAVDGYMVFSVPDDHPVLGPVFGASVPVVVVDEPDRLDLAGFVGVEDHAGAEAAARHLVDLGHRRVAIVSGRLGLAPRCGAVTATRLESAAVRVARVRVEGYLSALGSAGIDASSVPVWEATDNGPDAGRRAASDLLTAHPELTGLLCFSDQLAIGAIQAADLSGRRVPEDISVVGFDDIPRATTWEPPLTTIRQPMVDKGRVAARMLLEAIDGGGSRREVLGVELVARGSTGAAPRAMPDAAVARLLSPPRSC